MKRRWTPWALLLLTAAAFAVSSCPAAQPLPPQAAPVVGPVCTEETPGSAPSAAGSARVQIPPAVAPEKEDRFSRNAPTLPPPPPLHGITDRPVRQLSSAPVVITDLAEAPREGQAPDSSPVQETRERFRSGHDSVLVQIYRPKVPGRYPAVILLHGSNPRLGEEHYVEMAEDLARNGYVCLFVKYYDRGRKNHSRGTRADWMRTIGDALTLASTLPDVDESRMGLVGYSLGAFLALNYAPSDPRVKAVVAFYGGISPGFMPEAEEHMPPTLLLHGTYDRTVSVRRSLEAFEQLRLAAKPVDVVIYPKIGHGFTLHTLGGWDALASEDAWSRTIAFLDFHFKYPCWTPEVSLEEPGAASAPPKQAAWPTFPKPQALAMPYLDQFRAEGGESVLVDPTPHEAKEVLSRPAPRRRYHRPRRRVIRKSPKRPISTHRHARPKAKAIHRRSRR